MKLGDERVEAIRMAGLLHDVGKIGIRDAILLKPGKLTRDEFTVMRRHSELGRAIIAGAGLIELADWVGHLHERIDGNGYPDGLRGEEIPLESRVLHVADALESMTCPRAYREPMPPTDAVLELERNAGTQFDAEPSSGSWPASSARARSRSASSRAWATRWPVAPRRSPATDAPDRQPKRRSSGRAKPDRRGDSRTSPGPSCRDTSKVGAEGSDRLKTSTSLARVSTSHSSGRPLRS